jgi:hypothetical protein
LKEIELITQDTNVKHTNSTTIYNEYLKRNYLQKLLKHSKWKAWVQTPSGLIKRGQKCTSALGKNCRNALIKVENVSQEQISVIDVNRCRIRHIAHRKLKL